MSKDPQSSGGDDSKPNETPSTPPPREIPTVSPTDRINLNDTILDVWSTLKKGEDR